MERWSRRWLISRFRRILERFLFARAESFVKSLDTGQGMMFGEEELEHRRDRNRRPAWPTQDRRRRARRPDQRHPPGTSRSRPLTRQSVNPQAKGQRSTTTLSSAAPTGDLHSVVGPPEGDVDGHGTKMAGLAQQRRHRITVRLQRHPDRLANTMNGRSTWASRMRHGLLFAWSSVTSVRRQGVPNLTSPEFRTQRKGRANPFWPPVGPDRGVMRRK